MTSQTFSRNQIVLIVICGIMLVVLFANIKLFDLPPVYAQASVSEVGSSALNSLGSVAATTVAQAMASPTPGLEVDEALAILRAQAADQTVAPEVIGVYDRVEQAPVLIAVPTQDPNAITAVVAADGGIWAGPGQQRLPCRELRDGSAYTNFADWIGQNQHLMDGILIACEMAGG